MDGKGKQTALGKNKGMELLYGESQASHKHSIITAI